MLSDGALLGEGGALSMAGERVQRASPYGLGLTGGVAFSAFYYAALARGYSTCGP
jgi:hypothetical protein